MAKALNVSLSVTANTSQAKAELQSLQNQLTNLVSTAGNINLTTGLNTSELSKAVQMTAELSQHLKNATNINTGTLNFTEFSKSLTNSGKSITDYGRQLLQLGPQGQQAFTQLATAISKSDVPLARANTLLGQFWTTLKNTARWQISSSMLHGFMGALQGAYSYAQDLNRSLNDIQIVTQASDEHMAKFAEQANKSAKALSSTTTAYTKASLIYYQQGLNDQQVKERTDVTIKMANVTGQSAQQVSDQLTAIWNNFAEGSGNLEYYADVITALGAATASSSEEISRGLSKFAAIADTVGLSYENATAALATITATTRQSADTVGTGLRTLFSRLQSVSLGETLEDGVNLTKYSKALETVGVSILDAKGNLRDMDDILEDLGSKWDQINDSQKTALAQTVGGVRQYTTLMALMDNFDFYKQNQDVAKNSAGTLEKQQEVFEKSWLAAQKRMKAAGESLVTDVFNDKAFIGFTDFITGILNLLDKVIDKVGGLKPIIFAIGSYLTKMHASKVTEMFTNGIYNIMSMTKVGQEAINKDRQTQLSNLINMSKEEGFGDPVGKARAHNLEIEVGLQQELLANANSLSEKEQSIAQMRLDGIRAANEAYAQMVAQSTKQQEVLRNARSTFYQNVAAESVKPGTKQTVNTGNLAADKSYIALMGKGENFGMAGFLGGLQALRTEMAGLDGESTITANAFNTILSAITQLNSGLSSEAIGPAIQDFNTAISDLQARLNNGEDIKATEIVNAINDAIDDLNAAMGKAKGKLAVKTGVDPNGMVNEGVGAGTAALKKYLSGLSRDQLAALGIMPRPEDNQPKENDKSLSGKVSGMAKGLGDASQAMMNIGMAVSASTNMWSTWADAGKSAGDKIVAGLTGIPMVLGAVASGLNVVKTAATAAQAAMGWIAIIGSVLGFVIAGVQAFKPETEEEKTARLAEENTKQLESAKNAYNDLVSASDTHNQLREELQYMSEGTQEFIDKLHEANEAAIKLIESGGLVLGQDYKITSTGYEFINDADKRVLQMAARYKAMSEGYSVSYDLLNQQTEELQQLTETQSRLQMKTMTVSQGDNGWIDPRIDYGTQLVDFSDINSSIGYAMYARSRGSTSVNPYYDSYAQGFLRYLQDTYNNGDIFESGEEIVEILNKLDLSTLSEDLQKGYASFFSGSYANQGYITDFVKDSDGNYVLDSWGKPIGEFDFETFQEDFIKEQVPAIIKSNAFQAGAQSLAEIVAQGVLADGEITDIETVGSKYLGSLGGQEGIIKYQNAQNQVISSFQDRLAAVNLNGITSIDDIEKIASGERGAKITNSSDAFKLLQAVVGNDEEYKLLESMIKSDDEYKGLANDKQKAQFIAKKVLGEISNQTVDQMIKNLDILDDEAKQYLEDEQKLSAAELQDIADSTNKEALKSLYETAAKDQLDSLQKLYDGILGENVVSRDALKDLKITGQQVAQLTNLQNNLNTIFSDEQFEDFNKKIMEDILGDGTVEKFNDKLLSYMSSVDFSSTISALSDIKRLSNYIQDQDLSNYLDSMAEEGIRLVGKQGLLESLYKTEEFQDSLKGLQKTFKKTGKLSAKDIMEAADSCEILNDYLEYGDQSASALAAAIELMGTGGASSIDQISEAFLAAMGAAGAFEDQLQDVFKFIDGFSPDRSIQDIADFFSKTSDDMFTELGNGNYGGERLYQEAAAIWGDAYASHLKNFFIEQQTEALENDLGPEVLQEAYKEQFEAFDDVMQTVAEEGNMRAYWDFLLNGGGDQILGQEVNGQYGYSNVEVEGLNGEKRRLTISEALREHAGITNIGKNGDIEADLQGRTTEMFTQDVADALGISYDEAAVRVQEMSGKSAALTHDLKRNDAAAGLLALGQGHEHWSRIDGENVRGITSESITEGFKEMSWAEQTAFLQKYGDVLAEVDSKMGTHLAQLNEQRKAEQAEVATLRASGATRKEMNQSIADTVAVHEDLIATTEANGQTYTDFGQTMSNLTSAGYTQQEVLQAVADGAIDLGNAAYIVEDAFGNKIPVELQKTEDGLIDIEKTMSEAEKAIHDSNVAHDAEIQAKAFVEAFTGANIEPIDITVNVNGQESVTTVKEAIGSLESKDVDINVSDNGTSAEVQGLINNITGKSVDIVINPIDNVSSKIESIINDYNGRTITLNVSGTGGTVATGGYVPFGSHAMGTGPVQSHRLRPGISLTGEEGKEIVWNKEKGYSYIVGENHPEFVTLYPGDRVFNAQETAEILGSSALGGKVYESNADSAYGDGVGPKARSGKSHATGDNKKTKDWEPERYHLITRQLKDLQREYDRLDKIKENCYGTNKLEAIQKEIDATNELIEGQKTLIQEAEDYLKIDTGRLRELLPEDEFQIDENGNLLNFEELQQKYRKAAEVDKDESAMDIWKALQQYEETLDKLQEANVEMQNLLYQEMELRLEKITTKAELKIDFDEREIKLLDHYIKRIDDNIYHTAEVLALTEEKLGHINQKIEDTKEGINGLFAELSDSQGNKITKADGSNYTLEDWLALSNEERDLLDINDNFGKQLEEYMDNLLDYIEELEEFKTKGVEEFGEAFSELNDNVRSSIDLFDHYNQLLSSLKNITDLQGVKLSAEMRAARKEIDQIMFQNTQNNIQAEGENYKRLISEVEDLRKKIANTQDETLKKAWEEQLKTAEEELRNSEQNMLSLWETGLEQAKEMFEQALQEAVDTYETGISGMYGTVDELQKAWDQQKKNDEFYVKDFEKYYQISKLQRSINKDLDAAARTGNKQNQGLKNLYDELNEARENGVELSAYDLDIYEKRYEYEKALMDLEDARNNKSEVRLQRDANGNWGYVYTSAADDDELIAKQQAVDDKFYELQKATQERVASLSDDLLSEITGVGKRLQELRSSGASQETIDKYLEQEKLYLDNYQKGLAKALEDAGMTEEEARNRYGNSGFDILNDFQETLFSAITGGNEGLDEFFERIGIAIHGADSQMAQAGKEYQDQMNSVNKWFNESGEDLAKVIKGFASIVGEESSGTLLDSKEQIDNAKQTFADILQVARDFEQEFITIYQPIIDANEQLVADLLYALHALNREEYEGPDHSSNPDTDIGDIIGDTGSSSEGGSESGDSGSGDSGSGGSGNEGSGNDKIFSKYSDWETDDNKHWRYAIYTDGSKYKTDEGYHQWVTDAGDHWEGDKHCNSRTCQICKKRKQWYSYRRNGSTGGGCFEAGTQIIMADNSIKNIEDIQVNDYVYAYNEQTGIFEIHQVIKSYVHHHTPRVISVIFSNGLVLNMTPGHPILTTEGWKSRDIENSLIEHNTITTWLNIGDTIINISNNSIQVVDIQEKNISDNFDTYNIEVETCHTFLVNGLVVHNAKSAVMERMATGGYTGEWGPEGRMAILDEKELVLNKDDTKNFLDATTILRTIDLQTNMLSKGLGHIITPWISDLQSESLEQNVHIEASFPNAINHTEIEEAFDNLINKASQYANRKNMSAMTFQDMYTNKF